MLAQYMLCNEREDRQGFGRLLRAYLLTYCLLPLVLGWYFLGPVAGICIPVAIFGFHVLMWLSYSTIFAVTSSNATADYAGYSLSYVLVPFLSAWSVFGPLTGAALTLALSGLNALFYAVLFAYGK